MAWLHGSYVRMAIASAFNPHKAPYPKDPYLSTQKVEGKGVKESASIQAKRFEEWANAFNKRFTKSTE